jgi:hypothetical protein
LKITCSLNGHPCVAFARFGFGLLPYVETKRKITRPSEIISNPKTIGEHIKRERKIRGLRQIDVAEALGLCPDTICPSSKHLAAQKA